MKALFLAWYRAGKNIPEYFEFEPYLYGPCSLEVYSVLDELSKQGVIVQPLHAVQEWADYDLTDRGRKTADNIVQNIEPDMRELIEEATLEVYPLGFYDLLRKVYSEAPEFAENSLMKEVISK